jgi:glycine dehydrogenase subunit 2
MKGDGPVDFSEAQRGLHFWEPIIFEMGGEGRVGIALPQTSGEEEVSGIPREFLRDHLPLPQLTEPEVVRHYTRLSQWNFCVDTGFYPLGSCTMKYNPRVSEDAAALAGFESIHPLAPEEAVQGALTLMHRLERMLAEITGMDFVCLQPAAGAHGELTGMLIVRAYHKEKGRERHKVLIPDSAHGTNPASSALCGFQVVQVPSDKRGLLDPKTLASMLDEDVAAIMLTNPNTLGLFEEDILEVCHLVHEAGGLVYCDGANLNALCGVARVGDMGIDLVHLNLHKTFSTPHGGGGPGAGPLAVKAHLEPFLPIPRIVEDGGILVLKEDFPKTVGRMKAFWGHFSVMVRAYAYLLSVGPEGLRKNTERAVLNANYLRVKLKDHYHLPYDRICKHECVFSDKYQAQYGVQALDIAKRLMDFGFHPPTIYFPLIVKGALMIEPTETETPETLERFIEAMKEIAREAKETPEVVRTAPHLTSLRRLDEARAARNPILSAPLEMKGRGSETMK